MNRVLYIWQAAFPWDVRAEKICLELISRGCEVTILARWKPHQAVEEYYRGIRIVRVGHGLSGSMSLPLPMNPVWSRAISNIVRDWRPDLVIAREILLAESAAKVCRQVETPMIIDMAEHYPAAMRTWDKYRKHLVARILIIHSGLPNRVERRAVARADGVITVCDEQIDRLHKQYHYPKSKMTVVHNTPDRDGFRGVRQGSGIPPRVFGHHGYMTSQRGLDKLVRGFALALREDAEIELTLAGSGNIDELKSLAVQLGVQERIDFVGPYKHSELVRLYSEIDVGVIAYPVDESLNHTIPNKLFDYLACGKPVIVTPIRPFQRIVEEANAGLVLTDNSPEEISRGILRMRALDPRPMSSGGLHAAQSRFHWEVDGKRLAEFVKRYDIDLEHVGDRVVPTGNLS